MNGPFFTLTDPAATNTTVSGAKGAALAHMKQAGLPVPDAFIVPTETFRSAIDDLPKQAINALKKGPSNANHIVTDGLRNATLFNSWLDALGEAYAALGSRAVSARSSSTAEDLAEASFAGQYETVLNIVDLNKLVDGIGRVWASHFSPHAQAYRKRHRIPEEGSAMAVVVQRQIASRASGVLFTRDPQSGAKRCVISAALGQGEGVVSGRAPTDHWVVSPADGTVLSAEIANKYLRIEARAEGGLNTGEVEAEQRSAPALQPEHIAQLTQLGVRIEALFTGAQDIEFAVDEAIHILQARPITTVEEIAEPDEPWEEGLDTTHCWTKERGPFTRLEQDYMVEYMAHARACYKEVGSRMTAKHLYHLCNGYMYTRGPEVEPDELARRHDAQTERVDACTERGTTYFEAVQRGIIENRLAELRTQRRRAKSPADRVSYLDSCLRMLGYVAGHLHWSMGRPEPLPGWHEEYEALTGRPQHEANTFLQAIDNRMTRLVGQLRKLARIVQSDSTLHTLFRERRFDELDRPATWPAGRHFQTRFRVMLKTHGLRSGRGYGSSSSFQTPTWNMDPRVPLDIIATYAEQDLDTLDRFEHEARRERYNATRRLRRQFARDTEQRTRFEGALLRGQLHVRFLEDHNYYMEQCSGGTAREAIDAVGQDLVNQNAVDASDDVFHFSLAELRALATTAHPADQRALIAERKSEFERRQRMQPPDTLGADPAEKPQEEREKVEQGRQGNRLIGASASSGRATGRAVLIESGQRPRIHPGDILVAGNVGPEWTPAFAVLGGIVLDEGSLSQHAAIVAREYRIPSVMKTREATRHIVEGQHIVVDGDQGIVELEPNEK